MAAHPKGNSGTRRGKGLGHGGPAKGAGKGDGWGGPAKGPSTAAKQAHEPFAPGNTANLLRDPVSHAEEQDRAQKLRDHLYHLALHADRQETQLSASTALLNRLEGTPVQRIVSHNADDISELSDSALAQRAEDLRARLYPNVDGAASPQGPARLNRMVN